ncbi:hypothetical protein O1W71_13800 [Microbacterium sp. H37-C3]|uniref:hypothetical protein n=1 Tax=Microbacterium sp. H37-C3 TaxID=3004354 RepID=UPI0022AFB999|nr:hypothetical protein [Microbacterium sp. H37-C3]MCZ4068749.1 hypothetical protein [Microbacterium sp. H37-C3]
MVAIALAIIGILVGVLISDARVPSPRTLPLIAALGVGIAVAVGLFMWRPSGLIEGIAYAAGVVTGATLYAARVWSLRIPASRRPRAGTLMWMAVSKPEHLRALTPDDGRL